MLFNRKHPKNEEARQDAHAVLVDRLLDANELERRCLLLVALQTGDLKRSEAGDLLHLVNRLESVSGRR